MNRGFKPVLFTVFAAVLGTVNAQQAPAAPAAPVAPTQAVAPAAPAAPAAPVAPTHVVAPAAPTAPAAPVAEAPAHATVPAHAPVQTHPAADVKKDLVVEAPATVAPQASEPAAQAQDASAVVAEAEAKPAGDSAIILIVEDPKKKAAKKRRGQQRKGDLTLVDIPANFEIQGRKVMPIDSDGWGNDNLDTWWGRANLAVETRSDYFEGRIHLRMYPGQLYGNPVYVSKDGATATENRDMLLLHEAWAWHRGDYVNIKIGRWDNTTRYGSKTFGGYIDSKKNRNLYNSERGTSATSEIKSGFMSTLDPENILQFGLNNFSENVSLDIALVSSDNHLNKGDLRIYFTFKDLEGLKPFNIGVGYRSNVFDEIYSKFGDVTHTVDVGFSMNLLNDVGLFRKINLFGEAAFIGLDDQAGQKLPPNTYRYRDDEGGGKETEFVMPILGGIELDLYQGLDKIVIEAEYNGDRKNATPGSELRGTQQDVRDIQGSIFIQKKLNDRFTLSGGIQSEHNTKDFSFAGRLQGKIN